MDESDGNYMVINGVRYPVINSWVDVGPTNDGRRRWSIVTAEGTAEVQPAPPAEATAVPAQGLTEWERDLVAMAPSLPVVEDALDVREAMMRAAAEERDA
jgi:hypothetical protein